MSLKAIPGEGLKSINKVMKAIKNNNIASQIQGDVRNALYLGRGYNFPVALEGALKPERDFVYPWLDRISCPRR